ncbi:peptidylprolyl isomerase [Altererythrobacter aurantiacus]|uniref:Peptidyl-prolyl cis-trans isomerase n=1 Tax=Parapontixanthobacter aurantiacus TaxID=1463599 RepID=A0A844ZBF9_9SPHN|nr:FKBP-type peptidyl-prolyl cis-trans isomerase [Parapontixanthobacter aurantiacus]MXO84622.1 peptidylprolyl isomerase [Parapontixanthobacter aurantiacus]
MSEVTRVPLRPIAKGSLAKLWIAVIIAILVAAALAWATQVRGAGVEVIEEGTGEVPQIGDVIFVRYTGRLPDGTVFDQSGESPLPPQLFPEGVPFLLEEGQTVQGFFEGLQQVRTGGTYEFNIPADKAYGDSPPPGSEIPAGSDLVFDIEVVEIMSRQEFERRAQTFQQMMQMQQGAQGQGGPLGGPPQGAPPQGAPSE